MSDQTRPIVLFVATKENVGVQQFRKSLDRAGQEYRHLGKDAKWGGWVWRANVYLKELCLMDGDRWVCTSDADDVICTRALSAHNLQQRLEPGQILASAEIFCSTNCEPVNEYWKHNMHLLPKNSPFTHPNAGGLAGRAQDLRNFYSWYLQTGLADDQIALGRYCNSFPHKVVIDAQGDELCVVSPWHKKSFEKINTEYQITHHNRSSKPAIVHFSGEALDVLKMTWKNGQANDGIPKEVLAKLVLQDDFVAQDPTFKRVVYWNHKVFWLQWIFIAGLLFALIIVAVKKNNNTNND